MIQIVKLDAKISETIAQMASTLFQVRQHLTRGIFSMIHGLFQGQCDAYFMCANGFQFPDQYCPNGLMFNGEVCDWPA